MQSYLFRLVILLVFFLSGPGASWAKDPTQEILQSLTQKMGGIKTLKAQVKGEITLPAGKTTVSGSFALKEITRFNIQLLLITPQPTTTQPSNNPSSSPPQDPSSSPPPAQESSASPSPPPLALPSELSLSAVMDGKTFWIAIPAMSLYMKIDLEQAAKAIGVSLESLKGKQQPMTMVNPFLGGEISTLTFVRKEKVLGEPAFLFKASPNPQYLKSKLPPGQSKTMTPIVKEVRIWIGARDGVLRKQIVTDSAGKQLFQLEIRNVQVNTPIEEKEFSFVPPEEAKVQDFTAEVEAFLKGIMQGETSPKKEATPGSKSAPKAP